MDKVKVKIINKSSNALPEYATPLSAGMDLRANISESIILQPLERRLIPTGIFCNCLKAMSARSALEAVWL